MDDPVANNQHPRISDDARDDQSSASALSRRRLLKGAMAAVPAVVTLQSGAARANVSALHCVSRSPEFQPTTHKLHVNANKDSSEQPDWMRGRVSGIKVRNKTGAKTYSLIEAPEVYSFNKQYHDQFGRTWLSIQIENESGYVLDGNQHSSWLFQPYSTYHQENFFLKIKNVDRYKVVSVDEHGNYVNSHTKGSAVTASCWTSFTVSDSSNGGSLTNYFW